MDSYFFGPYAEIYWGLMLCNVLVPQLLWFPALRRHTIALFFIALTINVGMWLERFVTICVSLTQDYMPSSWAMYYPTFWDWTLFAGTFGLFLTLLFVFLRILPAISMSEVRELVHERDEELS